jgi:hypothetical protein
LIPEEELVNFATTYPITKPMTRVRTIRIILDISKSQKKNFKVTSWIFWSMITRISDNITMATINLVIMETSSLQ